MANSKVTHSPQRSRSSNTTEMGQGQKLQRKWEVYPSKNKFLCNGRMVTSPDIQGFLGCLALIVITGESMCAQSWNCCKSRS